MVAAMDVFPIYEQLWRRAQAEGARVKYIGWRPGNHAGYFDAVDYTRPVIALTRPYYKSPSTEPTRESNAPEEVPQPDLLEELLTLAHEYGHFRSWAGRTERAEHELYYAVTTRRGAATDEATAQMPEGLDVTEQNNRLRAALQAALNDDDRGRIMREEALAWEVGREVLVELGFDDLTRYDERTRTGLHFHRYRLGMEDLWPDDVAGAGE